MDKKILKDDNRIIVIKENDYVIKRFKQLNRKKNYELLGKLEMAKELKNIQGLVVPEYYEQKDGLVKEIYTKYIDKPNLYYSTESFSFETITNCFINLEKLIKKLHEKNIYLLDFTTKGNLKYDPKTSEIFALDYEDIQVDKYRALSCSYQLKDIVFSNIGNKYYSDDMFTFNADIYLLSIFWFGLCTKKRLSYLIKTPEQLIKLVNLMNEDIAKKILLCYDANKQNKYFDDDFDLIYNTHELKLNKEHGYRYFEKK